MGLFDFFKKKEVPQTFKFEFIVFNESRKPLSGVEVSTRLKNIIYDEHKKDLSKIIPQKIFTDSKGRCELFLTWEEVFVFRFKGYKEKVIAPGFRLGKYITLLPENYESVKGKDSISFSFGSEDYLPKNYSKYNGFKGPRVYNLYHPTRMEKREWDFSKGIYFRETDFGFSSDSTVKPAYDLIERYIVKLEKPVSYVQSQGTFSRRNSKSYINLKCPWDDNLSDEENQFKINNFCDTLNAILKAGSLNNYLLELSKKQKQVDIDVSKKFDIDNNGIVDIIDSKDFMNIVKKNQEAILTLSKTDNKPYVQLFVKLSNYLDLKGKNIQTFYDYVKSGKANTDGDLDFVVDSLDKQIESYTLLLFNSLAMIPCLCNGDIIRFYQIYECFDKLNIWNSNWENKMSEELEELNKGIVSLINRINSLENSIIDGFNMLNDTIEGGFTHIEKGIKTELKSINSSLDYANLFNAVGTYQLYRINKKTKP